MRRAAPAAAASLASRRALRDDGAAS